MPKKLINDQTFVIFFFQEEMYILIFLKKLTNSLVGI